MRLDGSVNRVRRTVDIAEFNRTANKGRDDRPFCFLMSTRAGGLGVNLQTADTVILYDSDWNPQVDAQAIARVHRIGQKNKVAALRMVTAGSIEQRVVERAEKKLYLDAMVGRGSTQHAEDLEQKDVSKQELLSALAFGADRIFAAEEGAMPTDAELAALLATAREPKPADPALLEGAVREHSKQNVADFDATDAYTVQGTDELRAGMLADILSKYQEEGGAGASLKDIAREAKQAVMGSPKALGKRQKAERLVEVTDSYGRSHRVLRENMYDLDKGEPSVFDKEAAQSGFKAACGKKKHFRQIAGRDYAHSKLCQFCWEPAGYWGKGTWEAEIRKCSQCPCVYHNKCLYESGEEVVEHTHGGDITCLHHACCECGIKATAAGGLLFRCECCQLAYCEDHLPAFAEEEEDEGWRAVGNCKRFEALGQEPPKQAYFITCCKDCREWKAKNPKMFMQVDKASPAKRKGKASSPASSSKKQPTTPGGKRKSPMAKAQPAKQQRLQDVFAAKQTNRRISSFTQPSVIVIDDEE